MLLIAITFVAIGMVAAYFFHVIGSNQTSVGLQVLNAQLSGGVLTFTVQNTGSATMNTMSLSVYQPGSTSAVLGPSSVLLPNPASSGLSSGLTPGAAYSDSIALGNQVVAGYTYTLVFTAGYVNNQQYTYSTSVTAN